MWLWSLVQPGPIALLRTRVGVQEAGAASCGGSGRYCRVPCLRWRPAARSHSRPVVSDNTGAAGKLPSHRATGFEKCAPLSSRGVCRKRSSSSGIAAGESWGPQVIRCGVYHNALGCMGNGGFPTQFAAAAGSWQSLPTVSDWRQRRIAAPRRMRRGLGLKRKENAGQEPEAEKKRCGVAMPA